MKRPISRIFSEKFIQIFDDIASKGGLSIGIMNYYTDSDSMGPDNLDDFGFFPIDARNKYSLVWHTSVWE